MAIYRGFKNEIEHDEHIIKMWNSVVDNKDVVWILGDISMEKTSPYYLLDRLKGIKKVVLDNHDKPNHTTELLKHVRVVCGMVRYKQFILTHCPIHPSELYRFKKKTFMVMFIQNLYLI